MGSVLSSILQTVLAATVIGAALYAYTLYSETSTHILSGPNLPSQSPTTANDSKSTPKSKPKSKPREKKKNNPSNTGAGTSVPLPLPEPLVVSFPRVIPGEFDVLPRAGVGEAVAEPLQASKKRNKKRKGNKGGGAGTATGTEGTTENTPASERTPRSSTSAPSKPQTEVPPPSQSQSHLRSSPSFDTDSSWTRIEPQRPKPSKSGATNQHAQTLAISTDVTSSDMGTSTAGDSPVTDEAPRTHATATDADTNNRLTLAEKLVPKPARTAVDDMLAQPDFPTLMRVMRVQPRADEKPAPGFTWEDYGDVAEGSGHFEDVDEEDEGGWGVVKGKSRAGNSRSTPAVDEPAATSSEIMTKKQRQNAKKREMAKAAKADVETARLAGLANHKRELERLRIIELSQQGGGKRPSGGMQASVDDRGRLVWD
ncbi:hypothetical protein PAXRUDRAFT_146974 [Paxillus rubicundulus Ve08.2h10]|uniref:Uncharacterized protein n=1 Tax=Paxillus rubicundulus Ve08.2h10 TaxID=930991 RepID=A0A0D0DZK9_9AGAM|nr:hypothetical protein PAXRUDRAFT_146974 [Paxillus rubicundulus Ve08.2h10]